MARRSIMFRPGLVERLVPIADGEKRTVNWLVNEAVEMFLVTRGDPAVVVFEEPSSVIRTPADVPAAIERVAPPRREVTPYSKEQQAGKPASKRTLSQATRESQESLSMCRHGLPKDVCRICYPRTEETR